MHHRLTLTVYFCNADRLQTQTLSISIAFTRIITPFSSIICWILTIRSIMIGMHESAIVIYVGIWITIYSCPICVIKRGTISPSELMR